MEDEMVIKLNLDTNKTDVLDVMIQTEESKGKLVNNNTLPEEDQIRVEHTVPSTGQRTFYIQDRTVDGVTTRKYREDVCIERHCVKITGLEDFNIVDGKSLLLAPLSEDIQRIRTAVFLHCLGVKSDDEEKEAV